MLLMNARKNEGRYVSGCSRHERYCVAQFVGIEKSSLRMRAGLNATLV